MRTFVVFGLLCLLMLLPKIASAAPIEAGEKSCSFLAHDGGETAADRCAARLIKLGQALADHAVIRDHCPDLPDFTGLVRGASWTRLLVRHRLGAGRAILAVLCDQTAYNRRWLLFADDARTQALPGLLLLRDVSQPGAPDFTFTPFFRALVDGRIYSYRQALGDGSGGIYAEYHINSSDLRPILRLAIVKPNADHRTPYHFQLGRRPQGAGWQRLTVPDHPGGCVITLADLTALPTCPVKYQ